MAVWQGRAVAWRWILAIASVVALVGCGGGEGGETAADTSGADSTVRDATGGDAAADGGDAVAPPRDADAMSADVDGAGTDADDADADDADADDADADDADADDADADDADVDDADADDADADDADADDADADDAETDGGETSDGGDAGAGDAGGCIPRCTDRDCGPDGCGGRCGACAAGTHCRLDTGRCVDPACVPHCGGAACGDDGCGGECGTCDEPERPLCVDGSCFAECVPDCRKKACGADGCGGLCGTCDGGHACTPHGHCVPDGWTCESARYDARDACDCGCGAPDPDCEVRRMDVVGCDDHHTCVAGVCQSLIPAGWTCDAHTYDDGAYCHCGCGIWDPDCDDDATTPVGCQPGSACQQATATCSECVPSCDERFCGDDGCGGSCGDCPPGELGETLACVRGDCVSGCDPSPLVCETAECGDDGCGGSCGECAAMTTCRGGACEVDAGMSCHGHCGGQAPGGCSCDPFCAENGDCCPDQAALCECAPDCDGKACGDDGCGRSCGECDFEVPFCGADGQCHVTCQPTCGDHQCGPDGCGGLCGVCDEGAACNAEGRCVPPEWACAPTFYADGVACDCSCGAPDPDCESIGFTMGCPDGAGCDAATGLCDVEFCDADSECPSPTWCVGDYPTADGLRRGHCEAPFAAAAGPGHPCGSHEDCATGLCVADRCRHHCAKDGDCLRGQDCVGVFLHHPLTAHEEGLVRICTGELDLRLNCGRQDECAEDATCLAVIDPVALRPVHRCGHPAGRRVAGHACNDIEPCALGLVCADGTCARPCPSGADDCPSGSTCASVRLFGDHAVDACQ